MENNVIPSACNQDNFSPDCSGVNANNLYKYLNRDDVIYIDVRNSDEYNNMHLHGFHLISLQESIIGSDDQLFYGTPTNADARYVESIDILNEMFPQDKILFIMCQSGNRVAQVMQILKLYGYDMTKIYNVGGMVQYSSNKYNEYTEINKPTMAKEYFKASDLTILY